MGYETARLRETHRHGIQQVGTLSPSRFIAGHYSWRVDEDHRNLLATIEILRAYITVLERPEKLLQVCATVSGDVLEARSAVAKAFDLGEIEADAVLSLQVRRFTPASVEAMRAELAELQRRFAEVDGS